MHTFLCKKFMLTFFKKSQSNHKMNLIKNNDYLTAATGEHLSQTS